MTEQAVIAERIGYVALLQLNRPERRNALGRNLVDQLEKKLNDLRFDDQIRVIVVTGVGDKAFCAGADLKERAQMDDAEVAQFVDQLRRTMLAFHLHPKITIAAINGAALGGGLEMALACDLRYAADDIRLGLVETSLAIIPGAGGTQFLPRLIGPAKAKELIFKGCPISADEALSYGLLNHVLPRKALLDKVLEDSHQMASNGPIALQMAKQAIDRGIEGSLSQGLAFEQACYAQVIPTEDRLEGLRAFKEKRKPQYRGC